jgi:hypothetical protein
MVRKIYAVTGHNPAFPVKEQTFPAANLFSEKNLIKLLYLFSALNGIYMMTEFIDLFRLGSDFLWIIRNVFGF